MIARHFRTIDSTPDLPGANWSHQWLAATIFSGISSVWGIEVAVIMNTTSVRGAQVYPIVLVFSPVHEGVATAAIRAAGVNCRQSRSRDLGGSREGSGLY